jgi:endonuclease/exonuclease/phosphatase family metal-dependent hydrolase
MSCFLRSAFVILVALLTLGSAGLFASSCPEPGTPVELTVMSFNIRVPVDQGENAWENRRDRVVQVIKEHEPDFVGTQEAVAGQALFLDQALEDYRYIGRGRNKDGSGSGVQIYYRHDRWKPDPEDNGSFQLSDTPEIAGSNTWGLYWKRMTSWARFLEHETGNAIYHFNTHLDVRGKGHLRSVALISKKILERVDSTVPVILSGDFNAVESSQAIMELQLAPLALVDAFRQVHPNAKHVGTSGGFPPDPEGKRIDYIFTDQCIEVIDSQIIRQGPGGTPFPSDHFAVISHIRFQH